MGRSRAVLLVSLTVSLIFLSPFLGWAEPAGPLETSLRPLMDQAGQVQVTLPVVNPEARQAAEDLVRIYQSAAFQERIRMERQRLAEDFFGGEGEVVPDPKMAGEEKLDLERRSGAFYLFVSSSMPLETLRTYAADLARLKSPRIVMVLRGFVGGARKIGPTAAFIADVLKADADCDLGGEQCAMVDVPFIVDPLLFRRARIGQVPALGWLRGEKEEPLVVCGDAKIGYLLEYLEREAAN